MVEPKTEYTYRHGVIAVRTLAERLLELGYCESQIFRDTAFGPEILIRDIPFAAFPEIIRVSNSGSTDFRPVWLWQSPTCARMPLRSTKRSIGRSK